MNFTKVTKNLSRQKILVMEYSIWGTFEFLAPLAGVLVGVLIITIGWYRTAPKKDKLLRSHPEGVIFIQELFN